MVIRSSCQARVALILPRAISPASGILPGPVPTLSRAGGGVAAVVQGVSSPAMPAPACTGLSAAVNHCSNALAGVRAAEEDVLGRAASARSQQSSPSRPGARPVPQDPVVGWRPPLLIL